MSLARNLARLIVDASGNIDASNLDNAVPADGSITEAKLANSAVTDAKIAAMAATKLTGTVPDANAPSGSVIQVVSVTKINTWSETTSGAGGITNAVTGLTASITPSSASNKILIMVQLTCSSSQTTHNINTHLYRDGTQIALAEASGVQIRANTGQGQAGQSGENMSNSNIHFVDSPATTSSVSYAIRLSTGLASSNTVYVNRSSNDANQTWVTRGVSTITVMEIAG
jgi:hypothetical protein